MRKNLTLLFIFVFSSIAVLAQTPAPTQTPDPGPSFRPVTTEETKYTVVGAADPDRKPLSGGVLNGKATSLPAPAYPSAARAVRAEGAVNIQVLIDEEGNVVSASAVSGHPLLRATAVAAAKGAKFSPTRLMGYPVKVSGIITYIFAGNLDWGRVGRALSRAENGEDTGSHLLVVKAQLPADFDSEKNDIDTLLTGAGDKSGSGKQGDQGAQNAQVTKIIESIQYRLLTRPVDLWRFNFKVTMGRVRAGINDDAKLAANLAKLLELANAAPPEAANEVTQGIKGLADYSGRSSFTEEDRKNILLVTDLR
jgi:TonB family protein